VFNALILRSNFVAKSLMSFERKKKAIFVEAWSFVECKHILGEAVFVNKVALKTEVNV
jgi:hypothetical protein